MGPIFGPRKLWSFIDSQSNLGFEPEVFVDDANDMAGSEVFVECQNRSIQLVDSFTDVGVATLPSTTLARELRLYCE